MARPTLTRHLLLSVLLISACARGGCWGAGGKSTIRIRWPASAPIDLNKELFATAIDEGHERILPGEPLPEDAPGVRVREDLVEGLYLIEVVLGDADFDDPLPLVILLHGRGDRPRVPGGPFGGAPTPMRLILPRGPIALGSGFAWLPVSVRARKVELLTQALQARTAHLADLIAALERSRPTLGLPIVTGFSQGGMLTFALAAAYPERFAVALPNAGWLPPRLVPTHPPPTQPPVRIRALHGVADPIVPSGPTRAVVARMKATGWDVELTEFDAVGHEMSPQMNAAFEEGLEAALQSQAPGLRGGLGVDGPEAEPYAPFEPLDVETIEALIQASLAEPEADLEGDADPEAEPSSEPGPDQDPAPAPADD